MPGVRQPRSAALNGGQDRRRPTPPRLAFKINLTVSADTPPHATPSVRSGRTTISRHQRGSQASPWFASAHDSRARIFRDPQPARGVPQPADRCRAAADRTRSRRARAPVGPRSSARATATAPLQARGLGATTATRRCGPSTDPRAPARWARKSCASLLGGPFIASATRSAGLVLFRLLHSPRVRRRRPFTPRSARLGA
jgi:hypothetical protein